MQRRKIWPKMKKKISIKTNPKMTKMRMPALWQSEEMPLFLILNLQVGQLNKGSPGQHTKKSGTSEGGQIGTSRGGQGKDRNGYCRRSMVTAAPVTTIMVEKSAEALMVWIVRGAEASPPGKGISFPPSTPQQTLVEVAGKHFLNWNGATPLWSHRHK